MTASPYRSLIADAQALGLSQRQVDRLRLAESAYAGSVSGDVVDGAAARRAWQLAAADAAAIVADGTPTDADIEAIVDRRLSLRFKDAKLAEIEITQAVAERLVGWAKTFALVTAVPLALGGVLLAAVGISDWAGLTKRIESYRAEIDRRIQIAAKTNDAVTARAGALNAKLADVERATRTFDAKAALLARDLASVERAAAQSRLVTAEVEQLNKRVNAVEAEQLHYKGFSPTVEGRVKATLNGFRSYLVGLGLTIPTSSMDIRVGGKDELSAYYDGKDLTFGATTAEMPDIVIHEYTHRIMKNIHPESWTIGSWQMNSLHEGIASYFAASYLGRAVLGTDIAPLVARTDPGNLVATYGYTANLNASHRFDAKEIQPATEDPATSDFVRRSLWAEALWDFRAIAGCKPTVPRCPTADRIVLAAWKDLRMTAAGQWNRRFGTALVSEAKRSLGSAVGNRLKEAFAKRGLAV